MPGLAVLAAVVVLSTACGSSYIELVVDSAKDGAGQRLLTIDDLDTLWVTLETEKQGKVLLEGEYPLADLGHGFPVILILEPTSDTAHDLQVYLIGTRDNATVARGGWQFRWQDHSISQVEVSLSPDSQ